MSENMKVAVYYGPRDLRVERIPIPEIGPHDILLKVKYCGICGSDVHSYKTGLYIKEGQIMGHEFSGEVVKVGDHVKEIEVGERGTGFYAGVCGTCYWCKKEQYMLCPKLFSNSTGYGLPGAFAEYVKISDATSGVNYHRIPDEIDDISAATIEPVAVAALTAELCEPKTKDQVVVMGAGLIGNAVMQVFKAKKVDKVIVTEVSENRLRAAIESGADTVVHAYKENVLKRLQDLVGVGPYHFHEGAMGDIVVEASGAPSAVEQSFEIIRSGGTIAFVGLPERKATIDTTKIVHKAPKIIGALGGDFFQSIKLLKTGKVKTAPLVSHLFPLEHVRAAFETQMNPQKAMKVMIEF
ncbi:zinc-dependent alcohol dehydrogenase [Salinibacillus xinjiangensis]|uniref:Alcohol dehydrogenase catalytic domain-containing protein n=1 Tax=Salinibacillus xinjiangensis TaxID=1229268 RepID=A0A6G1X2R2_9BACI|nr:alcohol dehydrogenase catalytic domain-containing protein [Salinibacillus xinjiangensis]MRG85234.1 alcohol dehydrogenase catalytic domain-containing protein [Salinibacillus xinjiangensis]